MPTLAEIESSLLDTETVSSVWTTRNGVTGREFFVQNSDCSLFLPAAGLRSHVDGELSGSVGTAGDYWSTTPHPEGGSGQPLIFSHILYTTVYNLPSAAMSVRCVKDETLENP